MYYSHVLLLLLLLLLLTTCHGSESPLDYEFDSIPPDASSSDETINPVNQDVFDSKHLFQGKAIKTNVTDTIEVDLYCEIDAAFCKKVQQTFISAAKKFAEVVNIKNKIV